MKVAIERKIAKLKEVGFIREVDYTTWLFNMNNRKWRMCVDYMDLNKVHPKDYYPLSSIDQLVNGASDFHVLSLLDAYSRYN
ncbi:hypothetical protein CR513_63138, partial [Mucuna pruriens]